MTYQRPTMKTAGIASRLIQSMKQENLSDGGVGFSHTGALARTVFETEQ